MSALFLKFHIAWGNKWTDNLKAVGISPMISEWSDGLKEFAEADMNRGFAKCRDTMDWPPSIAQFRKACTQDDQRPRLADILAKADRNAQH